jgi:acetolactate synthase-1/2/3 large subunit
MGKGTARTGGQVVARALRAHGVDAAFCVPGESYLEVLDGLYDEKGVRVVTCRHENGAANMAEAYGKLTGRVGVAMVTRGPGACNASIGVHTAYQDSTAMVLLVGQVARAHLGREAFQEVDYHQMFGPLAKDVIQPMSADALSEAVAGAFHTAATGRPGPVVVALPEDLLRDETEAPDAAPLPVRGGRPDPSEMERLRRILADADRPLILAGGGGWHGLTEAGIEDFAQANGIPVCTSFRRMDLLDNRHDCYVGEMGIGPNPKLVRRVRDADVLIVVGARLGEMTSQGYTLLEEDNPKQTLVHVHADPNELGKVYPPALGIAASVTGFAQAVARLTPVDKARWADWLADARADYEDWRTPPADEGALDLGLCMMQLDALLPDDAVVTVDAGNFSGWPQRYLTFGGGRRLLGPTSGAMGYSVPAGVAAAVTAPERTVVSCVGDGGFGMTGNEIASALQAGVAPLVLVFNNSMYGTIRMHQEKRHPNRVIATDLMNPDYAALARAHGCYGDMVAVTEQFLPAVESALASGKPAVIELKMNPERITTRADLDAIRGRG